MKKVHIFLIAAAFSIFTFNGTHGEEIIHGKKAKKNLLQYMVSVQYENVHICGGFLINPNYMLTAAHCYISKKSKYLSVVLGSHNIDPKRNGLKRYTVKSVHIHPLYKEAPRNGADIMLLKLSETINPNEKVKIAKIPDKQEQVKPNIMCQVAGWGKTEKRENMTDLLVADVSTINMAVCKKQWAEVLSLPHDVLCAGAYKTKRGACQGDSGGPLVCKGKAVGIVSFNLNRNCMYPNPKPNVYTKISAYTDWINKVIKGDD